jgi:hypothetical protein
VRTNADFTWDHFDPSAYVSHNYDVLRDDDAEIVDRVAEFFSRACSGSAASGVDVGTGANLYPALTMLPFCREITLYEHSAANLKWLTDEVENYGPRWDAFWKLASQHSGYVTFGDPRPALRQRAALRQGSIFDLPPATWDIGTMFFVAESLTEDMAEFERATECFVRALRPGAPFAAAFMDDSQGYQTGSEEFPAVPVTPIEVEACLASVSVELSVYSVTTKDPLRPGQEKMVLATGRAGQR